MKYSFTSLLRFMLLWLAAQPALAQTPPGWGWVNKLGTFVPNTVDGSNVAGLGRDAAGNLYLLGSYVGTPVLGGTPTTNAGESDVFLAKYSPAGALLWLRLLQSTGFDQATALTVEPSGRCTLAGFFGSGPTGDNLTFAGFGTVPGLAGPALLGLPRVGVNNGYGSVMFLVAVDANGFFLWADVPSPTYGMSITALHRDALGNCYASAVTGYQSALTVNGQNYPPLGNSDAILIKYTAAGQPAWARRVGAAGGSTYGGKVKTDAANAVYWSIYHDRALTIDGRTVPFVTPANPVSQGSNTLVKLSAGNAVRWTKNSLLKSGTANAQFEVMHIDATNTMYLSGGSYGGTITNQDNTASLTVPTGSFGTCIARCDTSGAVQWLGPFAFASTVPNGAQWVAASPLELFPDATGYTALTNTAYAGQTMFPPSTTFDFSRNGLPCVVRYDYATHSIAWARTGGVVGSYPGTAQGSTAVAAAVDAAGNAYVAGNFTGAAQFGTITVASTSPVQQEIFLAKLDQSIPSATARAASGQAWAVFPNPASGAVQLTGLPPQAHVRAYDAQGRAVRELTVTGTAASLAGLAPGLYLLQVSHTVRPFRPQRLLVQ